MAQEGGTGGFLTAEPDGTVDKPRHEPLKAHRHLNQLLTQRGHNPVNHRRAHQGLAHRIRRPARPVRKQVINGHRQVMVRVHQPIIRGHNAMPVRISIITGGNVVLVAVPHQRRHGIRAGTVHPNLTVRVQCHEPPCGVHQRIHHRQIQLVGLGNRPPIIHRRTTHGVRTNAQPRLPDHIQIHHIRQIRHIGVHIVVFRGLGIQHPRHAHSLDVLQAAAQQIISTLRNPVRGIRVGRATIGRIIFKPTIPRRIMRRRNHNAVGTLRIGASHPTRQARIIGQNRMRHRRRRGIAAPVVDKHLHVISQQHLHGGNLRRLAQRMRIPPNKNRATNTLRITVIHNGLRGCQNMVLVKRIIQRRPPVPRCTKHHLLVGIIGIRNPGVVRRHHFRNINKVFRQCNLAGTLMSHTKNSSQKRKIYSYFPSSTFFRPRALVPAQSHTY